MASKMAALQILLVLLWACSDVVTACPSECTCGPYKNRPSQTDLSVDCSGKGLFTIPAGIPPQTKALNMANNQLTAIDPAALAGLNLVEINLSGNSIQEVPSQALRITGDCNLDEFEHNQGKHVKFGRWQFLDLTQTVWPCLIDLRKNPISRVKPRAFAGSKNFTVFLGQSSTLLTIETPAFGDTQHVIGIHISEVPKVNFFVGSMDGIINVGWIVLDKTEISFRDQIFSSATNTRPRWFRISNSKILEMKSNSLILNMDISATCSVTTYPFRRGTQLTSTISSLSKGGVELINNTMPVLQTGLFGRSNIGGMFFHSNRIAGFEPGVFARDANDAAICIIIFLNNHFKIITTHLFRDVNVVHLTITERNLITVQDNAFAGSTNIDSLKITTDENPENNQLVIKAKAFSGMNKVKIANIQAMENKLPKLVLEPSAFDGLNVDYFTVDLYDSSPMLQDDVFTGLTVVQRFMLTVNEVTKISPTAFGRNNTNTNINRLEVDGAPKFPCDCKTVNLGRYLKDTVKQVEGLTCTATLADGTVIQDQPLDSYNMTCIFPSTTTRTNAASGLQGHLIYILLITFLFKL